MKLALLPLDFPTKNNRVYPLLMMTAAVERATKDGRCLPVKSLRCDIDRAVMSEDVFDDFGKDTMDIIGIVHDLKVEQDSSSCIGQSLPGPVLTGMVTISLDLPSNRYHELLDGTSSLRPYGKGKMEGNVVIDYELDGFCLTNKPA